MKDEKKIIMYDSPEAAKFTENISGWVSSGGYFHGKDEHFARWSGCTHKKCEECGSLYKKNSYCRPCWEKKQEKKISKAYAAMEIEEWDGKVPVVDCGGDNYFMSWDEIHDHCEEFGCTIESLRLVICEGISLPGVDINDHFCDAMHEDQDSNDIDQEILDLVRDLNDAISMADPMTYHEGDKAVKIK